MDNSMIIVDDEGAIREAFRSGFVGEGYKVFTAACGEEALDLIRNNSISVVFLDLHLPGMNGVELCREIKRINPVACIFAVTGHQSLFELAECREAGFEDYFIKPVRMGMLFKAAEQAFERIARWRDLISG